MPTSRVPGQPGNSLAKRPDSPTLPCKALGRWALTAVTLAVSLTAFSGCMTTQNGFKAMASNGAWNDSVVVLRNRSFSAKAWHKRKHHFCEEKHNKDFCAGFRAGYEDTANGADGCTPAFPPKEYWSWEFQSAEGHGRTSAWMAGYPHGARAAEEDGVSNWSQLQMSPALQSQYQHKKPAASMPPLPAGQTPIPSTRMGAPTAAQPLPMSSGLGSPQGFDLGLPPGAEIIGTP